VRKLILLLTTIALALFVAGGVALAATKQCQVGVVCNGTTSADTITGTNSNDTINGLAGNDIIRALDGIDLINGGTQNDTMNGGAGNDSYRFSNNLGADRISADSAGVDTIDWSRVTTFTGGIEFDVTGPTPTCSSTSPACVSLGGNFIENLIGTGFTDNLFGNTLKNQINGGAGRDFIAANAGNDQITGGAGGDTTNPEYMDGQAGGDTYKGYGTGPASGVDNINDTAGAPDKLNLMNFNVGCGDQPAPGPGCNPLFGVGHDGDDVIKHLVMDFADGSSIRLLNYFDGTATGIAEFCSSGPGPGLIETIIFADDTNVDFAQVMNDPRIGGCTPPAAGADSPASVQQQPQGSIQEVVLQTPEPSASSATTLTPEKP
jgi:Ca2+-binding RTX toxin-like protein